MKLYRGLFSLLTVLLSMVFTIDAQQIPTKNVNYQHKDAHYPKGIDVDTIAAMHDTNDVSLIVFKPFGNQKFSLLAHRPDTLDESIVFSCPAAFTGKDYKSVVGRFVGEDTTIENPTEKETGLFFMNGENNWIFAELNREEDFTYYFNKAKNLAGGKYFQQMLLIYEGSKIECNIFGKQKPTFRRALAMKDKRLYVVESLNRMDVGEFTDVMIKEGFSNAIYLDMGTWSEGYYRDMNGNRVIIGRLKQNTSSQSNWLIFRR